MEILTKYADAGDVQIAYQVHGDRDHVLIIVPGLISQIELQLDVPEYRQWLDALTAHFKVVVFDKRGQGLSDRGTSVPGPEQRMDDITAVVKAEGIERFSLLGYSEGGAVAILYAATFPERIESIAVFGAFARFSNCEDYPHMREAGEILKLVDHWGKGSFGYSIMPDKMPEYRNIVARLERACATPNALRAMLETNFNIDIRAILPDVQMPVLVMHCADDVGVPVGNGRYLAEHLPNATYVEFPHGGHMPWFNALDGIVEALVKFMLGDDAVETNTQGYLSTVLFTDIVGSSEHLAKLGDQGWREKLDAHDRLAQQSIAAHQGHLVKHTGDGLLVTFDGPARGIKCAQAICRAVGELDLAIRCGLHIGEVEPRGDDITGLAVHVAARVMDKAAAGQTLVTRTLHDLIAGSGLELSDVGEHELKGLPDNWQLYAAN